MQSTVAANIVGGFFVEVYKARWPILIGCALSLVFTIIYIKFMDWCAFWIAWLSVFLILGSFVITGIYALVYRNKQIDKNESYADTAEARSLLALAWITLIIGGLYFLCMLCKFKALRVAIAVIETAGDYFADTKRILFVPILYFILAIGFLAAWVGAVIGVASIGSITVDSVQAQSKNIEWDAHTTWAMWYMFFGCVWIVFFIISCNEFVVII